MSVRKNFIRQIFISGMISAVSCLGISGSATALDCSTPTNYAYEYRINAVSWTGTLCFDAVEGNPYEIAGELQFDGYAVEDIKGFFIPATYQKRIVFMRSLGSQTQLYTGVMSPDESQLAGTFASQGALHGNQFPFYGEAAVGNPDPDTAATDDDLYWEYDLKINSYDGTLKYCIDGDSVSGTISFIGSDQFEYTGSISGTMKNRLINFTTSSQYPVLDGYIFQGWSKTDCINCPVESQHSIMAGEYSGGAYSKPWRVEYSSSSDTCP